MVRTEGEKTKTLRMGVKAENVEKMSKARERGEREWGLSHKTGRRQSRRREGNRKESEMNGKDVRRERGEPGRGHQSLVRRGNPEPLGRASVTDLGQDHQVRHVDKQVDGCDATASRWSQTHM